MLRMFRAFHDCISFDITYKISKYYIKIEDNKLKYWNIGVFSTFDENMSPHIVAICLILD